MGQGYFGERRTNSALEQVQAIERRRGRELSTFVVRGTQKFEWSTTATIVFSGVLVMFMAAAFLGQVVYPGVVFLFIGYNAIKPWRTVSLSRNAVTVWEHSFWSSKITGAVVVEQRSMMQANSFVSLPGIVPVALSSADIEALQRANRDLGPASVEVVTTPPPPCAPNPSLVSARS